MTNIVKNTIRSQVKPAFCRVTFCRMTVNEKARKPRAFSFTGDRYVELNKILEYGFGGNRRSKPHSLSVATDIGILEICFTGRFWGKLR